MKLFLTDVDGCLLDWSKGFEEYMTKYHPTVGFDPTSYKLGISDSERDSLVDEFNASEDFGKLKPYADAIEIIPKIVELGYKFVTISTCMGKNPKTKELREQGLINVFGKEMFHDFICLPLSSSKLESLQKFKSTYWIDDKVKHSIDGAKAGHISFNMTQPYNIHEEKSSKIIQVNNWLEVYNTIISRQ